MAMNTTDANIKLLDGYVGLLKNLSTDNKLDLISKLSESLKSTVKENKSSFYKAFGAWDKNDSAGELIKKIQDSRNLNRNFEEFWARIFSIQIFVFIISKVLTTLKRNSSRLARKIVLSQINTLAELKYGVANSQRQQKNKQALDDFLSGIQIVPIFQALDTYASEKARLRREGNIIDDFDLLIGSTAVTFDMIMVTNNTRHFSRITGIQVKDWIS